ncbi:sphingomyelin phosphodiesterase [Streptomyces sp. NPDC046716]|uniref:sphingomyelin phosphodiesterase n=1 Tax=Streptomyces sp. NPDC046716 TaxID=3157093 RepID=UPI0033CE3B67
MPRAPHHRLRQAVPAALIALAAVAAGAPAAHAAAPVPALRVLTYNTFLMSQNLYPNWGQEHRATEIPQASFFQGNDVVVLQEAFDNSASDHLKRAASGAYPYQTPVVGRGTSGWDATSGAYSSTTPEDGGVTLLSKWPIVHKEQYVYKDACGSDWWSNKGFVYAVLDVDGTKVHVVGTHTQSTDSGCGDGEAQADRARQFRAISAFLDERDIPAAEEVIVAGDMNVDSHGPEYASMLANAGLAPADSRTGHSYSFDTQDNSVARYRYPDDPREDLDHVLFKQGHARPARWDNEVIADHSAPWTVSSWGKSYTYTDLSDHYPLVASPR